MKKIQIIKMNGTPTIILLETPITVIETKKLTKKLLLHSNERLPLALSRATSTTRSFGESNITE